MTSWASILILMDNFFQAIGVIRGEVIKEIEEEKEKFYVSMKTPHETKKYRLFYSPHHRKTLSALKLEIKNHGNLLRLIVYPKILHLPGKDKPHQVRFQLVGFNDGSNDGVAELDDFEFKLAGKWQFIAVCKTPVISVHRNLTEKTLEYYKTLSQDSRKLFAGALHLPLLWEDAPVEPFRFNRKLEKEEQGETFFVQIKAKFLPDKDLFCFDSLMGVPTTELPKFIKFKKRKGKKDKYFSEQKPDLNKPAPPKPKLKSKHAAELKPNTEEETVGAELKISSRADKSG